MKYYIKTWWIEHGEDKEIEATNMKEAQEKAEQWLDDIGYGRNNDNLYSMEIRNDLDQILSYRQSDEGWENTQ